MLLTHSTSSKQSRIQEYLAVESLPELSTEEIEEIEKSCEGTYFRKSVSIRIKLGLLDDINLLCSTDNLLFLLLMKN